MRRTLGWLGIALLGWALVEASLQVLALAAPSFLRGARAPTAEGAFRILCLGDSHTYGWGVERAEAYPAQLERLLDPDGSVDFEVVNLGVPSSNSSQMVAQLPGYLSRHEPDLLIVTIGANDVANTAGHERALPTADRGIWGDWLWKLRSYRLLRYALHQRRTVHAARAREARVEWAGPTPWRSVDVHDGVSDLRYDHRIDFGNLLDAEAHQLILRRNLDAIVRHARAAGVPLVFASYAHDLPSLGLANRVMSEMPDALFVSQRAPTDLASLQALPGEPDQGWFFEDLHPTAPVYEAMAVNLRDALVSHGLVPVTKRTRSP